MKTSAMIRYGSLDTKGPNRKDKVFYIVFETEEEAQEMVNMLDVLRLESGNRAKKTPDEWEKMGFKINLVDELPSIPPTAIFEGLLSEYGDFWIEEAMRDKNLPHGQYWAFEWNSNTIVYYDSKNPA